MNSAGHKILIIDDDSNISDMYSMQFTADGFWVEVAPSSKIAESKIAQGYIPDVILLDIIMPGDNGIQLLEKMVRNFALHNTKIIIFSNLDMRPDIDEDILKKIAGYYLKVDIIPSEMSKKIKGLLGV